MAYTKFVEGLLVRSKAGLTRQEGELVQLRQKSASDETELKTALVAQVALAHANIQCTQQLQMFATATQRFKISENYYLDVNKKLNKVVSNYCQKWIRSRRYNRQQREHHTNVNRR